MIARCVSCGDVRVEGDVICPKCGRPLVDQASVNRSRLYASALREVRDLLPLPLAHVVAERMSRWAERQHWVSYWRGRLDELGPRLLKLRPLAKADDADADQESIAKGGSRG